jgi:hypothetical protein
MIKFIDTLNPPLGTTDNTTLLLVYTLTFLFYTGTRILNLHLSYPGNGFITVCHFKSHMKSVCTSQFLNCQLIFNSTSPKLIGLDTKTCWLTDRESECVFDFAISELREYTGVMEEFRIVPVKCPVGRRWHCVRKGFVKCCNQLYKGPINSIMKYKNPSY